MSENRSRHIGTYVINGALAGSLAGCAGFSRDVSISPTPTSQPDRGCSTYVVQPGDSLWKIAQTYLGDGNRYREIIVENDEEIPGIVAGIHPNMNIQVCTTPEAQDNQINTAIQPTTVPPEERKSDSDTNFGFPALTEIATTREFLEVANYHTQEMDPAVKENVRNATVLLQINTPDGTYSCSGIHIGGGKIATAHHCFGAYDGNDMQVRVLTAQNDWYEGGSILNFNGIDAAVFSLDDYKEDAFVQISPTTNVRIGETLFVDSKKPIEDGRILERFFGGIYIGRNDSLYVGEGNLDITQATQQNLFIMMIADGAAEKGFSGSGVVNQQGELTGILIGGGTMQAGSESFTTIYVMRSEVIQLLSR